MSSPSYIVLLLLLILIPHHYSHIIPIDFQTICQAGIRQDNTNYIHCGRKQLTQIPNFSRTTNTFYDELVLNDNFLTEIPANAFQGLRVKRLNLSGNKIRSIDRRAFIELANYLEELLIEFDSQHVQTIPEAIRFNLVNLRSLKLIDLSLTSLPNRTFAHFYKLERLSLCKSNLQTIDREAFSSSQGIGSLSSTLRELHLDQNRLDDQSWPHLISNLPNLEILTLSQNHFLSLENNLFNKIPQLKMLDLSSNGLQTIDSNVFNATPNLERLYLQNNELNSLQLIFISSLHTLKELNLDFNRITFLPEELFQSNTNLIYLSLQGNDLNRLTNQSFSGLKQLRQLNLGRNRIQLNTNDRPFQHLLALQTLNLDRNTQLHLTSATFFGLTSSLLEISLQNCNLTSISSVDDPLSSFIHLERVKLASNNLRNLPAKFLLGSIRTLVSLDLQRNNFQTIPQLFGQTSPINHLVDLDLSSNDISTLNQNDLIQYKYLKTIGLTGNPLHCDCHLQWLKQWLKENYDHELIKFLQWTCATPKDLFGKQVTILDKKELICQEKSTTLIGLLSSTRTTTISSTMPIDELLITNIEFNQNSVLIISWERVSSSSILPKYYHVQIYDQGHRRLVLQRLVDARHRSIQIDVENQFPTTPSVYTVCINTRQKKHCRNVLLTPPPSPSQPAKSESLIVLSSKPTQESSVQMIFLLGGTLVGALLVCFILILVCYWRLRRYSSKHQTTTKKLSQIPSINTDDKIPQHGIYHQFLHPSIFYRPLNILGCPPSSHQQCPISGSDTSECSLHSSTDTNGSLRESSTTYHIYQQIPSVHNCQLHPPPSMTKTSNQTFLI